MAQQAALAVLRLCSAPVPALAGLHAAQAEWAVRGRPLAQHAAAATLAEAARRLRVLCGGPGEPAGVRDARAALLRVVEDWEYPWRRAPQRQQQGFVFVHGSTAAPFPATAEGGQ